MTQLPGEPPHALDAGLPRAGLATRCRPCRRHHGAPLGSAPQTASRGSPRRAAWRARAAPRRARTCPCATRRAPGPGRRWPRRRCRRGHPAAVHRPQSPGTPPRPPPRPWRPASAPARCTTARATSARRPGSAQAFCTSARATSAWHPSHAPPPQSGRRPHQGRAVRHGRLPLTSRPQQPALFSSSQSPLS